MGLAGAYAGAYAKLSRPYADASEIGDAMPCLRGAYAKLTRPYANAAKITTGRDLNHWPSSEPELTPELTRNLREAYALQRAFPR